MFLFINGSCYAPDYDRGVRTALAHDGHPGGYRYLQGLGNIRDYNEQKVPGDRMKNQHPPGIAGFAGKQHDEMNPDHQYHGKIHGENREEHILLIGRNCCDCCFCSYTGTKVCGKPCQGS